MSDTLLETLVFLKCNSSALGHVSPLNWLQLKLAVNSPGHLRATQTMTWRQLRLYSTVSSIALIALSLWQWLIKCLLHELMQPLSYFFLIWCSLEPRNLKRSLNVFWRQVLGLGLEAQVLVNNTACMTWGRQESLADAKVSAWQQCEYDEGH